MTHLLINKPELGSSFYLSCPSAHSLVTWWCFVSSNRCRSDSMAAKQKNSGTSASGLAAAPALTLLVCFALHLLTCEYQHLNTSHTQNRCWWFWYCSIDWTQQQDQRCLVVRAAHCRTYIDVVDSEVETIVPLEVLMMGQTGSRASLPIGSGQLLSKVVGGPGSAI